MKSQVKTVYEEIKQTLGAHGAKLRHIVKETVFTTDMQALKSCNDLRIKFYVDDGPLRPHRPGSAVLLSQYRASWSK